MLTTPMRTAPLMLAMALSASALALPALSQAATPTAKPVAIAQAPSATKAANARPAKEERLAMSLSEDGFKTMRDIRMARVSIFNGDTQAASDLLAQATHSLNAVDNVAVKATSQVKNDLLPIDGRIVVADDFIDTPAKRQHIGKANEHLQQGRADKARDELRLAEVDASFSRVLMPLDATRRHLNAAEALIQSNQFYEANLALKAAEDGLQMDTVAITELPAATSAH